MSGCHRRGYAVEVGFAAGVLSDGLVDGFTFRHTREEVEDLLEEQRRLREEVRVFFPAIYEEQEESDTGIVGSVRIPGRHTPPSVMPRREWEVNLADPVTESLGRSCDQRNAALDIAHPAGRH